jgi:hypothetical protein
MGTEKKRKEKKIKEKKRNSARKDARGFGRPVP